MQVPTPGLNAKATTLSLASAWHSRHSRTYKQISEGQSNGPHGAFLGELIRLRSKHA